jgi:hypothetical protein
MVFQDVSRLISRYHWERTNTRVANKETIIAVRDHLESAAWKETEDVIV